MPGRRMQGLVSTAAAVVFLTLARGFPGQGPGISAAELLPFAEESEVVGERPTRESAPQEATEALNEQARERDGLVDQKLRQAQVLLRIGRYEDCIDLCDEILFLDRTSDRARDLRAAATDRLIATRAEDTRNKRKLRDAAALDAVTRETFVPHRGEDVPRPTEVDVPFRESEADRARMRAALDQTIPEINLVDTDVAYLLQLLFTTHNINIIYPPDAVEGKRITIQARDLPLRVLLQNLSRSHGLHYTVSDGVVWLYGEGGDVKPGSMFQPAVIALKTGQTGAWVRGEGGEDGGGGTVSDVEAMLQWMEEHWPHWPEGTSYKIDSKTNRLVISSTPDVIDDVREVVEMLDVPPVQVLISSLFVQIGKDDLDQLGFSWSVTGNPQPELDPDGGFRGFPDKITMADSAINTNVAGADALALALTGVLNEHQFDVAMNALVEATSTKVLTAPRVIALNNQVGHIELTRNFPYPTDWESTTQGIASRDVVVTASNITPRNWQEEQLGFDLKVVPSVGADMKTVNLQLVPTIKDLDEFVAYDIITVDAQGNPTAFDARRPTFQTSRLESEVTVEDGHTVVIGGLFRDNITDTEKRVPFLSKVPGLGKLFRSRNLDRDRSCLFIFVTARIVRPDNRLYTDVPQLPPELRAREVGLEGFGFGPELETRDPQRWIVPE